MSRCRLLPGALAAFTLLAPPHRAAAQGTVLDRARKAAQDAANAGTKAATDEVNRQINSAVLDAASADVADGSFEAVLSPWSTDNTKSVQLARYAGNAFVVTTPTGRQVIICDPKGVLPWQTTFTISKTAVGTPTNKPLGTGKSSSGTAATSGRGGGAAGTSGSTGRGAGAASTGASGTTGRGAGAASTGAGRSGGAPSTAGKSAGAKSDSSGSDSSGRGGGAGTQAAVAPSADEKEYKLPSPQITVALPTSGPKSGAPSQGSIIVANVSQEVLGGAVKIRFAQATVPGEKGPQVVDFGVAFKAMVLAAGTAPSGCLAPASAKTTVAGRGAAPGATPPATGRGGNAGSGATTNAPPAVPTTPAIVFAEGDVLLPKIDNVKLLAAANDSAKVTTTLKSTDELVYLGDEQNGYVHVQGSNGEGWARKALLKKK